MVPPSVLDWLLEEDQPAVRYLALRQLCSKSEGDSEVRGARSQIRHRGWAAEILAQRQPGGWWVDPRHVYQPKYLSTNWMLLVLSDLGVTRDLPEIEESCEYWIARSTSSDGGFSIGGAGKSHLCYVGNMARALIRFGYADHPRVRAAMEWLVRNSSRLGGWSCWGSGRNLDSWEGLSAFAAYSRSRWTPAMEEVVAKGVEFFLERELYRQGDRYEPWFRFHYPAHYYYDLLVGLDLVTSLGHADDRRLRFALEVLRKKRRKDGRWYLDALHPDAEGAVAAWWEKHPNRRPTPFGLETPGRPSKMITLTAARVLARVEGTV
jgi:hypothetical protein